MVELIRLPHQGVFVKDEEDYNSKREDLEEKDQKRDERLIISSSVATSKCIEFQKTSVIRVQNLEVAKKIKIEKKNTKLLKKKDKKYENKIQIRRK